MGTTVALLVGRDPQDRYSLHRGYADSVWQVDATPVVLVPPCELDGIGRYVEAALDCDALCATGGGDVDPQLYGSDRIDGLLALDALRDAAELAAVRAAVQARIPVLGICRGVQLMTVALGGTLYQDLPGAGYPGHWEEDRQLEPVHVVRAEPGTCAAASMGGATMVNSIHHQGVRDPGPRLSATAWSDDGLIEAVEAEGLLGVQWHPERLAWRDARHLGPFRWLVSARVAA
jgi:putative glutamine amidotransferase